jgi:hydroxymethylpyrimidine/phosphomethylpyrimidine kinase
MKDAAAALGALGSRGVLVKGGHLPGDGSVDVFWEGNVSTELTSVRYDTEDTHGTGCALSAAIAAFLAHGDSLQDAVHRGKRFVSGAIRRSIRLGEGFGPVNPGWNLVSRESN